MGSLSTRRVVRRPPKITVVDAKGGGYVGDDASNKENLVNCSLYSLFETHYEKSNNSPSTTGDHARGRVLNNVLQPRKRSHIDGATTQPDAANCSRELSPPELTTSDTFKPAKRTLATAPGNNTPGEEDEGLNQQSMPSTPRATATRESCDVLVSSPTESKSNPVSSKVVSSSSVRRDNVARKTPTQGRRFSIVRLSSIAREGGALVPSKSSGFSSAKKHCTSVASERQANGKDMLFSAKKRTTTSGAEQSNRPQAEVERVRSRVVLERRKSLGLKTPTTTPVAKQGIGSFGGGRLALLKTDDKTPSPVTPAQQAYSTSKTMADSIRTRKLAMVLKSEQRLAEKNEQCALQLRRLEDEVEKKDHEMERLRSAALMLNNMINRQSTEISELRFRLKETFNENAEVRDACETLERELRKTREVLRLERMQRVPSKSYADSKLGSLTTQFQSLALRAREPCLIESCIEEGQEDSESQGESEGHEDSEDQEGSGAQGHNETGLSRDINIGNEEALLIQNDGQYTLQDLEEMVMQEEDLLKETCANALKELNLPLTPLLTPNGSLDVGSLKAVLASISSREDYLTSERIGSIRRLSAWLNGSS